MTHWQYFSGGRPRDQPGVVKKFKVLSEENISPYNDKYDKNTHIELISK